MGNRWLKSNIYLFCAVALWLAALSPIGKLGKGVALTLSLSNVVLLNIVSKELIAQETRALATKAMRDELSQTELALATHQEERELERIYGINDGTYPPEVAEELRKSLEALVQQEVTDSTSIFPTSDELKSLYLAVVNLLEAGKSETYVIEKILCKGGRKFDKGKSQLQQLLQLGKENEW